MKLTDRRLIEALNKGNYIRSQTMSDGYTFICFSILENSFIAFDCYNTETYRVEIGIAELMIDDWEIVSEATVLDLFYGIANGGTDLCI